MWWVVGAIAYAALLLYLLSGVFGLAWALVVHVLMLSFAVMFLLIIIQAVKEHRDRNDPSK
mgnify:CR=1 FL=1